MADNIQRSEYPSAKIPTVLEVNTDTGAAILYRKHLLGRTPIATSEPSSNGKWTITKDFAAQYNLHNVTNLSPGSITKEAQQVFTKTLAKLSNNERAAIINKHSTEENRTRLSKEIKIPGVIDPKTQTKTEDTTLIPTVPKTEPETGDTLRPSSEPPKNVAKTRDQFGDMNYPITRDPQQDIIKFNMLKYEPKKIEAFSFGGRSEPSGRTIGSVTLPIPGGISDSNACNWGDDTMNPLQIAAAGLALSALDVSKVPGGLSGVISGLVDSVKQNNEIITGGIAGATAAAAVGSNINSMLGRTQGMILNPNLELLFQAPTLRPFTFQFKMSPRSADEAKEIVRIIRFFKQGMAPIREESRLFLKTPHTFKIRYLQLGDANKESPYLNKFKECALLSCSIQYTPEGNYAPYEDGAMSSYQMSLQFKELEPVYNDEYDNDNDASIGF